MREGIVGAEGVKVITPRVEEGATDRLEVAGPHCGAAGGGLLGVPERGGEAAEDGAVDFSERHDAAGDCGTVSGAGAEEDVAGAELQVVKVGVDRWVVEARREVLVPREKVYVEAVLPLDQMLEVFSVF